MFITQLDILRKAGQKRLAEKTVFPLNRSMVFKLNYTRIKLLNCTKSHSLESVTYILKPHLNTFAKVN